MKPVLSGHRIKRTVAEVLACENIRFSSLFAVVPSGEERGETDVLAGYRSPINLFPLFTLNETFIKRTRTPKNYLKWSFLLLPTCIKRTLVFNFHHPTSQTPEMRKIATHKFFIFTLKNAT